MGVLLSQFDSRVQEIELYFSFLRLVVVEHADLIHENGHPKRVGIDHDLVKILKANAFLLLYNLVESSIRDALTRIYDSVAADRLTYAGLRAELREIWVQNMVIPDATRASDATTKKVVQLIDSIIAAELITLDAKLLPIAGNLDAAKVRELARRYGFSHQTTKKTQGGAVLLKVKTERNNLAHGQKSFAECGRDLTFQ